MSVIDTLDTPTPEYLAFIERYSLIEVPKFLYLILDRSGKINKIFQNPYFEPMISELLEKGDISHFFHWDEKKQFRKNRWDGFHMKRAFDYFRNDKEFFGNLEVAAMRAMPLDDGSLFGRISLHEIIPNTLTDRNTYYLYFDQETGLIKGFNTFFHSLIKDRFPAPDSLINAPLSNVFSRFPGFSEAPGPAGVPDDGMKVRFTADLVSEKPDGRLQPESGSWIRGQGCASWESSSSFAYLHLTIPFNTAAEGFEAGFTYEPVRGSPPLVLIRGQSPDEPFRPGNENYAAGLSPEKSHWIIKRRGYVIASKPVEIPLNPVVRLDFSIKDRTLALKINGNTVIAYRDLDFIDSEKAYVSLMLRPECSTLLKEFKVLACPGPLKPLESRDREAVLPVGEKSLTFTLERFYNNVLTSHPYFYSTAAYYLNDVTELREKVSELGAKYKTEARKARRLEEQVSRFEPLVREQPLIGDGARIRAVREWADKMASTDATILIEGPTGSGKEVLARHIHERSGRANEPFIKVDCSTIPQNLIESQLFGHEKGAFTGADGRFIGLIEGADKGTLFLDEIANLTPSTQAKLLQFLNDFTVTRVGGTEPVRIDVRCIAASNRPLMEMIREGVFRDDLYYRISVFQLSLPSLNERREDIPALAAHFLAYFNLLYRKTLRGCAPDALEKLSRHDWRGNIREFRNVMERAVLFSATDSISADLVRFDGPEQTSRPLKKPRRTLERLSLTPPDHVIALLKKYKGSVAMVIRELGATRGAFYYFMKRHDIDPETFRKGLHQKQ